MIETNRLHIRRITLEDAEFMLTLLNDPGWIRFIGERHVHSPADARRYIQTRIQPSYDSEGFGFYAVVKKVTNEVMGICGLVKRPFLTHPDIGFAFLPQHTGQGYAYEAAQATLAYAHETLHLPRIGAITLPENERSIILIKKLGLQLEKTIIYPDTEEELLLFLTSTDGAIAHKGHLPGS